MTETFYINCKYYKDKTEGEITEIEGRKVGIAFISGCYFAIDIETGLMLNGSINSKICETAEEAVTEATTFLKMLLKMPEAIQQQVQLMSVLTEYEKDKIFIKDDKRTITGTMNYKNFEVTMTNTPDGTRAMLDDCKDLTQEEMDLIMDQIFSYTTKSEK
jgi:hypothetical protein